MLSLGPMNEILTPKQKDQALLVMSATDKHMPMTIT